MLLTLTLLLCAFSASFPLLLLSSLAIGLTATVAQDIIPAAATLAPEASRGKTVGAVMTGLLAGILLSRVFSGALAEYAGWRSVYALAALGVLPITLAIWHMLPRLRPHNALSYPALRARWGICGPRIPSCGAQRWRKVFCHWASALSGQRWR